MKHFFELPGYPDRIVVIDYLISHIISKEFQDEYDTAVGQRMKAEANVCETQEALQEAGENPALDAAAHKRAVETLEIAHQLVEELDQRLIPVMVDDNTVTISIAKMPGAFGPPDYEDAQNGWTKFSQQQWQKICEQLVELKYRVAATSTPFRDTQEY
jgi:hypothetical protein